MTCWADTPAPTPLVQTLCTTRSSRNWPCLPRINTSAVGEPGTTLGAEKCLSLLSPFPAITNICLAAETPPQQQGAPVGHRHGSAVSTHRLPPEWGTSPRPPPADFPHPAAPSHPGGDAMLQPQPTAPAVAPGLCRGSPMVPGPKKPRPGLPSPVEPQSRRNPSETEVSWNESLFICLIKMCSPGAQTPFHLSHLQPRPSKIKPNKYQTRESKGHM